jgi:hypothetical protein
MATQPYDPIEHLERLKQLIREGLAYSKQVLDTADGMGELEAVVLESERAENRGCGSPPEGKSA